MQMIAPVGRNFNLVKYFLVLTSFFYDMLFFPHHCFQGCLDIARRTN